MISRNTAFTYRNKPVDTKQIGRELGVRYVLEGSVRRSANKVRVNAQLIDAEADAHLWAEQFDGDIGDLFALQNEITSRIAVALNLELTNREAARPTDNADALDFILRARAAYMKGVTRDRLTEIINLYERALALDPHSVEAQSQIANMLAIRAGNYGWSASPAADLERAEELVGQALSVAPRDWLAHYAKGSVLRRQGNVEDAISEFETALALNPNWLNSLNLLAWCKIMTGSIAEAIPLDPPEPRRSRPLRLLYQHGNCALAAVATRRGNCLVREGARPPLRFRLQLSRCDIRALKGELPTLPKPSGYSQNVTRALLATRPRVSAEHPDIGGCQRSLPCPKPIISPGCARPACPRNNGLNPRSCRDPRRRCGDLPTRRATLRGRSNPTSASSRWKTHSSTTTGG